MFQWLIVHTVVAAATAVVVAAACRCFRLRPALRHLLWLVVLVKLLTPPIVAWPWTLPMHGPAGAVPAAGSPPGIVHTVIIDEGPVGDVGPPASGAAAWPAAAPPPADPSPDEHPAAPAFSWDWLPAAAAWAWLAGGAAVALRNAIRILRWRRRLARGLPAPDWLAEMVRALAGSMGVRPPRLVVLPGPLSPMIWGFGVPRLIWPLGLEDRLSAEGRRSVLLHELAHLKRRDHWIGWLLLLGGCVWWWHPLFWWVRRRLTQEAELACDAHVVGAAPDGRRAYAEALLEVSQRLASTATAPALGAAAGRRDLERRLVMIMRGPAGRRLSWAGLAGVGMLGLLALPAWTLGEGPKTAAPPAAEPANQTPAPVVNPFTGAPPAGFAPVAAPPKDPNAVPPADADREKKIRELEAKVEQLMLELQELRGQAPNPKPKPMPAPNPGAGEALVDYFQAHRSLAPPAAAGAPMPAPGGEAPAEVITLTRVSYKLKAETAAALASFLKDNVKTAILETKTDGENLTVTTTPEAQHAIGTFIRLIQGKAAMQPGMMGGGFGGGAPLLEPGAAPPLGGGLPGGGTPPQGGPMGGAPPQAR